MLVIKRMSTVSVPQLLVGPNESSSLIRSDSQFTTKKITLTGDDDGVALNIVSTNASSIRTLGGMDITGQTIYTNTTDVTIDENTGVRSAAFEIDGGLVIRKKIDVQGDACFQGTIFNEDIATKNNLVSQAPLAIIDILYAKRIYCIDVKTYSDPATLAANPNVPISDGGNAVLDIVICTTIYTPNLNVLEDESLNTDLCGDDDIQTVLHYYRGENFTGKYCIIDELHATTIYCPSIYCVRGRPMDYGFGGFSNSSAGTILGTKTYLGGVQAENTWRAMIDTDQQSETYLRLRFQRFNGLTDTYEDPPSDYRVWMSYRDYDIVNATWDIVRGVTSNGNMYFLEKQQGADTSYISSDVSTIVRGAISAGYYMNRIYVSYEILDAAITSISCSVQRKVFDRTSTSSGISLVNIAITGGNLSSGTIIGDHHRYIEMIDTTVADSHATFQMEIVIVANATSTIRFHGCFIEFTKQEMSGF
jgi:hypothetical protein